MDLNKIMRLNSVLTNSWFSYIFFVFVGLIFSLLSYWIVIVITVVIILNYTFNSDSTIKFVGMDDQYLYVKRIFKDQQKIPFEDIEKIYKGTFYRDTIYVKLKDGKKFSYTTMYSDFLFGLFTEAMEGEEYSIGKLKRRYIEWSKNK